MMKFGLEEAKELRLVMVARFRAIDAFIRALDDAIALKCFIDLPEAVAERQAAAMRQREAELLSSEEGQVLRVIQEKERA